MIVNWFALLRDRSTYTAPRGLQGELLSLHCDNQLQNSRTACPRVACRTGQSSWLCGPSHKKGRRGVEARWRKGKKEKGKAGRERKEGVEEGRQGGNPHRAEAVSACSSSVFLYLFLLPSGLTALSLPGRGQ